MNNFYKYLVQWRFSKITTVAAAAPSTATAWSSHAGARTVRSVSTVPIRSYVSGEENDNIEHVNKIPTIKGFDILRNPKLNKVGS